jgi:hypothetical protein
MGAGVMKKLAPSRLMKTASFSTTSASARPGTATISRSPATFAVNPEMNDQVTHVASVGTTKRAPML